MSEETHDHAAECKVTYDENADVTHVTVTDMWGWDRAEVSMRGSTAVVKKIRPEDGYDYVTGEACTDVLEYLETLPFVQAATFGDSE